jgi:hypothetical protein
MNSGQTYLEDFGKTMSRAKAPGKNSKHEIRNSKQFLNDERQNEFNVPNRSDQNRRFEFSEFRTYLAAICFGFSASDFDIRISGFA